MPDDTSKKPYDLTEEASKRQDGEATNIARQLENGDVNSNAGSNNEPNDDLVQNKVWTSLSDE